MAERKFKCGIVTPYKEGVPEEVTDFYDMLNHYLITVPGKIKERGHINGENYYRKDEIIDFLYKIYNEYCDDIIKGKT